MVHKPTILSIGTATQDVFLIGGDIFKPVCDHGLCFEHLPLGAKLDIEQIVFSTGGNAMNAAVTFARQGLDGEFMGVIGTEPAGQSVLATLDKEGVGTRYLVQDAKFETGYSTILLAPTGERTILRHHSKTVQDDGAPLNLDGIKKADWLYLSSVGSMPLLEKIVSIAAKNNVRVALNPGTMEINQPDKLKALFEDIDVLLTNKEEMQQLVEGGTSEELVRHAAHLVSTVVVSDGPNGVVATDSKTIVSAGEYEHVKPINRLGAGDAFGSGFVAMIAQGKSIEEAVTFASANATSVVTMIGSTTGILHAGTTLHDMPMESKPF
jgi:ribokinase